MNWQIDEMHFTSRLSNSKGIIPDRPVFLGMWQDYSFRCGSLQPNSLPFLGLHIVSHLGTLCYDLRAVFLPNVVRISLL
jgi:hypothetical protein